MGQGCAFNEVHLADLQPQLDVRVVGHLREDQFLGIGQGCLQLGGLLDFRWLLFGTLLLLAGVQPVISGLDLIPVLRPGELLGQLLDLLLGLGNRRPLLGDLLVSFTE